MVYLWILVAITVGYLIGSIPWALIIGKYFFKVDIREHGSKNLGGTNAGRVLGRKAGVAVMIGDLSKAILAFYLLFWMIQPLGLSGLDRDLILLSTGPAAALGHAYPIFAKFKGGKIVSIFVGFVVCTNYYLLILGAAVFFLVLALTRYVSLASMTTALTLTLLTLTQVPASGMLHGITLGTAYSIYFGVLCIFLLFRHRKNMMNLYRGCERKVKWID